MIFYYRMVLQENGSMAGMVSACSSVSVILWDTLCSSGKEKEGATDRSTVRQSVVGCGCDNMVYFETAGQRFCGMGQSPGNVMADGMAGFLPWRS